jgi:16S rRNA (guanine527-N7)-methyltransferase
LIRFHPVNKIKSKFPNISKDSWPLIERWMALMRVWNEKVNLISRKDIEHLEERHLAHCLAITNHLQLMPGAQVLDVGTGGGLPGIIMAICYPQAQFTLIDSIGKKIAVVEDLIHQLGLENVKALQTRAESINQQFDFITGRAVKNLPEFFSWIKGNLRRGKRHSIPNGVLYWKGGQIAGELETLGIRPTKTIHLEAMLEDPFFEQKYILHFDARDVSQWIP